MAQFFDLFPTQNYSLSGKRYPSYQLVRNILFRTAMIKDVLSNSSSYIKYVIRDGDTPEILAAKVYGNPEAHWIIMYANDIIDPQFDWPLNSTAFANYIADKYRSMAEADEGEPLEDYQVISWTQNLNNANSVHHYEKVVKQENKLARVTTEFRYKVDAVKLTNNDMTVPYDTYQNLTFEQDYEAKNLEIEGQTVIQTIYKNFVTYYDYEFEANEAKRNIRIIKKEYYPIILKEFEALTKTVKFPFFRNVN